MASSDTAPRRRRLNPDTRRQEILLAARKLFSERPYTSVSTADVADAAGVARSLVHHYFGGIRELFLAVVADGAGALADLRRAGPETPLDERLAANVKAGLDVVAENRETWLAIVVYGASIDDPGIRQLITAGIEQNLERTLAANSDVLDDTPTTRSALRCFNAFIVEATRQWLTGECTREEIESLLVTAFRTVILETIPALESS
jgi:AcrR family transcriptional regulator